jgi:hypothetical protein
VATAFLGLSDYPMQPNLDKIDDAVLALLHLTSFRERKDEFSSAWKRLKGSQKAG